MKASQTAPFGTDHTPPIQTKIIGSKQVEIIDYDSVNKANKELSALTSPPSNTKNYETNKEKVGKTNSNSSNQFFSSPTKRQQAILNEIKDQNQRQDGNSKINSRSQQSPSKDMVAGITSKTLANYENSVKGALNPSHPPLKRTTLDALASSSIDSGNHLPKATDERSLNKLKLSRSLPLALSGLSNNDDNEQGGSHNHNRANTDHRNFKPKNESPILPNQSPLLDQSPTTQLQNEKSSRHVLPPIAITNDQLGKKFHHHLHHFDRSKFKHIYNTLVMMDKSSTNRVSRDELMEIFRLYQIPIEDDELNQLFNNFQDPQDPKYAYYAEILKFMNAAQEGDFQNTRLAGPPLSTSNNISSPTTAINQNQPFNQQDSKNLNLFHDRQDAKLIQLLQKEFQSSKTTVDLTKLKQVFANDPTMSIDKIKETCRQYSLPLSPPILDLLIERCQLDDQKFNCSTFLLFLERAQPFPLPKSSNPMKESMGINPLSSSSKGKASLDNKLQSISDRQRSGPAQDEQVQWKQDILVKLDSLSKEQEMLKNRQELLEKNQPTNGELDFTKVKSIQDIPWIDRYMELAIAFDAADINNRGTISKTEALHLINKYNVSHQLNYNDKLILSAIDVSLQADNNKLVCIGNLLEQLNLSDQNQ